MRPSSSAADVYPPPAQLASVEPERDEERAGLLQDEEGLSSADERLQLKRVDSPSGSSEEAEEDQVELDEAALSPLDATLELIGMGRYQKTLL